jgi:hypothetical protein
MKLTILASNPLGLSFMNFMIEAGGIQINFL